MVVISFACFAEDDVNFDADCVISGSTRKIQTGFYTVHTERFEIILMSYKKIERDDF